MAKPFTILVTGGAGYIGSHAVLALLDAGWPVAVIDNLTTGFRWAVPEGVAFHEGDIEDAALVARIIKDDNIGAIMHFAGSIIVPESVENPLKYYHNNSAKSRSLIESAVNGGVHAFHLLVHRSNLRHARGKPGQRTHAAIADQSLWHVQADDRAYVARCRGGARPEFLRLRYFNVAGADPQARTGQSTAGATHLIKVAVEAALGKRESVAVFGTDYDTPDGTGVRDYIHVSDLAAAHVLALEALIAEPNRNHLLNCGYGRGFSVLEVLDAVDRVTNRKITRKMEGRRAGDPDSLISDNRAIMQRFPWQPKHADLDEIVAHALAWERKLIEIRGE